MSTVDPGVEALRGERDAALADLSKVEGYLNGALRERDAALAEVERLRQDYEDAHADRLARTLERDRTIDEREYLKVEVERLRAELADEQATHAKTISNFEEFAEANLETTQRLRAELDGMRNLDPSVLIQQLGLVAVHTQDGGRYHPEDVWFEVDRATGEDGTRDG